MKKNIQSKKIFWLVLAGYLILAIIFNYPLIRYFNSAILAGDSTWDAPSMLGNLWSLKTAILSWQNPLVSHYIYYPQTISLAMSSLISFYGFISIPFQYLFGLISTYNLLYLLGFALSGLGAFYLADFLVRNRWAAFFAGFVYAFTPYIFSHISAGHLDLIFTWTIPIFIYFFLRATSEKKLIFSFLVGIILTIQAYSDFYYAAYLGIFIGLYLIWQIIFNRRIFLDKSFWINLIMIFLIFVIFAGPIVFMAIRDNFLNNIVNSSFTTSNPGNNGDLVSFFGLNPFNPWWGKSSKEFVESLPNSFPENTLYLGYIALALSFLALYFRPKKDRFFWLFSALIFFILALGPHLQIYGKTISEIYLPFYYLTKIIPIFNISHIATRFVIMVILSLSILSAYAISDIFSGRYFRTTKINYKVILIYLFIFLLAFFEYFSVPTNVEILASPNIYKKIANEKKDFTIIMPFNNMAPYYQTIHHKTVLNARQPRHMAFDPNDYYNSFPGLRVIINSSHEQLSEDRNSKVVLAILKQFKIGYIFIDKGDFRLMDYLENILGFQPAGEDTRYNLIWYQIQ